MVLVDVSKSATTRPPCPKAKTASGKPISGPKRGSHHADVNFPKAMNNPNWRARQYSESLEIAENAGHVMKMPRGKLAQLYMQTQLGQDLASQSAGHAVEYSRLDGPFSESSPASEAFAKVLQQVELKPIDGRQMSIIEVEMRPETPTPTTFTDNQQFVKISRYHSEDFHKDSTSSTEVEISPQSASKIHPLELFQAATFDRLSRQTSTSSSHSQLHESRSIDENSDEDMEDQSQDAMQLAGDRTPKPPHRGNNCEERRFQRLLQRLNGHVKPPPTKTSQPLVKKPEKPLQRELEPSVERLDSFRKPVSGSGRREQTISDFNVNYWNDRLRSLASHTTTHDSSEDSSQSTHKTNTWNPKAREFFSLGQQQSPRRPLPWETANPLYPTKPAQNFNSLPLLNSAAWLASNTPALNAYPCNPGQAALPNQQLNPATSTYNPSLGVGLTPGSFGATGLLAGAPTAAPAPSLWPIQPLPPVSQPPTMPFGNLAVQAAAQQMSALPYLASLASLNGFNPMPYGQEKPTFPVTGRRPPVPKPALPNAGAQLAYEEWIEWRKANEPGYAVECKARQQRRSQRNKAPGAGDKSNAHGLAQVRAVAAA